MNTTKPYSSAILFALASLESYRALMARRACPNAGSDEAPEAASGLGGRLLLVGSLTDTGRALTVAANIAGAASLVGAEDGGKQALRDGVVDFLVNSLDEALRILKNEIRKKLPVSVGVDAPWAAVVAEMQERGVLPDLLSADLVSGDRVSGDLELDPAGSFFISQGSAPVHAAPPEAVVSWSGPATALSLLGRVALECLGPKANTTERWLRFAPRYLGRLTQGVRVVNAPHPLAEQMLLRLHQRIEADRLDAKAEILEGCI